MVKLVSFITLFNVYFSELSGGGSKSTGMKLIPYDFKTPEGVLKQN